MKVGYRVWAAFELSRELRRWRAQGVRPRIWWRDDDVREPTAALDRLISTAAGRPLALAVIPDGRLTDLAHTLAQHRNVGVGQHGVDHEDRAGPDGRSEYALGASQAEIEAAIAEGRRKLIKAGLPPGFFTPPWNACQPALGDALAALQFHRLSAGNAPPMGLALPYLATDMDLIRWSGAPRFRGTRKALSALRKALRERRRSGRPSDPIGLLTHHLDHDEPTWRFLDWFLPFADRRFDWVDVGEERTSARSSPSP